jgi:hypothetical protein
MKNLLAVVGGGDAAPVLEAALLTARRFNSHIVGLNSFGSEYDGRLNCLEFQPSGGPRRP